MKNFLTVLIISLSITNFYAQEIPHSIIKSEVFKDEYKHSSIVLVEDDGNDGVFIVRSYAGGLNLFVFILLIGALCLVNIF